MDLCKEEDASGVSLAVGKHDAPPAECEQPETERI